MAYTNLSYTHIISYTQYAVHSIIMYTMLNQEFTVSSRLHNNIPANIFLTRFFTDEYSEDEILAKVLKQDKGYSVQKILK